ncbi:MAG: serine hydrolase domain-containing protein, partial [Pseudomonadota bacterium]
MLIGIRNLLLIFLTLSFIGCQPEAADTKAPDQAATDALGRIVEGQNGLYPELSGLQVLVLKNGVPVQNAAFGFARLGSDGPEPLRTDHKVRIASISKLLTAIGVMQLVEQGRVDLDADVSVWFDFDFRNPSHPETPITIRQLLAHTSSIRDGGRYWLLGEETFSDFFLPNGALFNQGAYFASDHPPGSYFAYSNLNFGALAGIIERASGRRFDQYMRENVLLPLGLNTSFSPCDVTRRNPELLATTFRKLDDEGNWDSSLPWRAQNDGETVSCFVGMDP